MQDAAEKARVALANILNVNSIPVVLPMLFKGMKEFAWQTKLASHLALTILAQRAPWQLSRSLPWPLRVVVQYVVYILLSVFT